MKKSLLLAMAVGMATIAFFSECTKPTLVGADILDQDQSDLVRVDTFTLLTRSIPWDTVTTHFASGGDVLSRYPLGSIIDPILGHSRSTVYFEVLPTYGFSEPEFANARPDSLVLTLYIDTSRILGSPEPFATLDVFRLEENIPDEDLITLRGFDLSPDPVGSYAGPIWPVPISPAVDYIGTIETKNLPQIRIPLDLSIAEQIMAMDSTTLVTDSLWLSIIKGFGVRFRDPVNAYAGLFVQGSTTGLHLYYTVDDTLHRQVRWSPIGSVSRSHYSYDIDRSGVTYPDLLTDNSPADSIHVIQGSQGFDLEVHFPYLPQHESVLVNLATLELTVCQLNGSNALPFGPPAQLEIYTYEDDRLILVDDVIFSLASGSFGLESYFGGVPLVNGQQTTTYRFNLSAQVQKILLGEASPTLFVRVRQRETNVHQALICGSSSPSGAPKLTITYTRLNP